MDFKSWDKQMEAISHDSTSLTVQPNVRLPNLQPTTYSALGIFSQCPAPQTSTPPSDGQDRSLVAKRELITPPSASSLPSLLPTNTQAQRRVLCTKLLPHNIYPSFPDDISAPDLTATKPGQSRNTFTVRSPLLDPESDHEHPPCNISIVLAVARPSQ